MRLGVRGKLFAVSLALMLLVGLVSGVYAEKVLRNWLEGRIETELFRDAETAGTLLELLASESQSSDIDRIATRIGAATQARVTVISAQGVVLGDSDLQPARVADIENHARRREVQAALAGKRGISRRYSTTLGTDMLYVAVLYGDGPEASVVRVAMPLSEVDQAVSRLRLLLAIAGLVGLGLSVFMTGLASQLATRALRGLVDSARRVAKGEGVRRLPIASSDELGHLATTFNGVVDELDRTVTVLADQRDHLETILESMSEGVLALDSKLRITRINRAALELLAIARPTEAVPLLETIRNPALIDLLRSGSIGAEETTELKLPGARFAQAHAAPLQTGGCVLVLRDVTRTRQLEATRRDFVANVSHELRTPVSVIRANAETLAAGAINDPESAPIFLEALSRNADRLSRILADLLGLSSMEAGEYELALEGVELNEVVARVVRSLQPAAEAKGVVLSNELSAGLLVQADTHAVEQVLSNLLENAVRYSDQGGTVLLRSSVAHDLVRVEVADNGPGIAASHRERVFERFYRVDPGRSREMGGTGLGLAIVKHLVEAMHGQIGVEPREPRGSVFWFRLPLAH